MNSEASGEGSWRCGQGERNGLEVEEGPGGGGEAGLRIQTEDPLWIQIDGQERKSGRKLDKEGDKETQQGKREKGRQRKDEKRYYDQLAILCDLGDWVS